MLAFTLLILVTASCSCVRSLIPEAEEYELLYRADSVVFPTHPSRLTKSQKVCKEYAIRACEGKLTPQRNVTRTEPNWRYAKEKEYPHMALIGFGNILKKRFLCSGALISDRYVLGDAYCTSVSIERIGKPEYVRLGVVDYTRDDDGRRDYEIEKSITHPQWDLRTHKHNMALHRLIVKVTFSEYILPICLRDASGTKEATVTGWESFTSSAHADTRLTASKFTIGESQQCTNTYKNKAQYLRTTTICASLKETGKGTCQSLIGAPLLTQSSAGCSKIYDQIGMLTGKTSCTDSRQPALFILISYYIPWIESIVWK